MTSNPQNCSISEDDPNKMQSVAIKIMAPQHHYHHSQIIDAFVAQDVNKHLNDKEVTRDITDEDLLLAPVDVSPTYTQPSNTSNIYTSTAPMKMPTTQVQMHAHSNLFHTIEATRPTDSYNNTNVNLIANKKHNPKHDNDEDNVEAASLKIMAPQNDHTHSHILDTLLSKKCK